MTTAQILYGIRNEELVHIDDVERGLACKCTCPQCDRALVAKKGEVLSHHFAHEADEVDCNPTPESLVHSYAKQQVSKLKELILPGFEVRATVNSNDGQLHELYWRHYPHYSLDVKSAEVEAEVAGYGVTVKPDVLFQTGNWRLAAEVYFRHPVPPEKIEKLQQQLYLPTVEIDLSDLPTSASSQSINAAIADISRWTWLHNQHSKYIQSNMCSLLGQSTKIFVPRSTRTEPTLAMRTLPSKKLATADGMKARAEQLAVDLRRMSYPLLVQRVRSLDTELRIALHCHYIGMRPTQLPLHLMQTTDGMSAMGMHPVLWQTGVFAKFCMTGGEFSIKTVEDWVRNSFEDKALQTSESITQTTNGFSPVAETLYHFLRNLSTQCLLFEVRGRRPWESKFAPIKSSKVEVLEQLLSHPAALTLLAKSK